MECPNCKFDLGELKHTQSFQCPNCKYELLHLSKESWNALRSDSNISFLFSD